MKLYKIIRTFLFMLEAERAHAVSLFFLEFLYRTGLLRLFTGKPIASPVKLFGLEFPNAVGLAAGLDKDAEHIAALQACGFGFIEVGTVTPKPQAGNPKPRLFRLIEDEAIINHMGFNNQGVDALVRRVGSWAGRWRSKPCILGINIGKNRETPIHNAIDDYVAAFEKVYETADYVTMNVSSPNTPGLRSLQYGEQLESLLSVMKRTQSSLQQKHNKYVPLLIKIAPDLEQNEVEQLAVTFLKHKIDGVIATNTTNIATDDRPELKSKAFTQQQGGLSGRPLKYKSNQVLSWLVTRLDGKIPVIAVGGIMTANDALEKFALGASLVQIYTGFIYQGPALVHDCAASISANISAKIRDTTRAS